MSLPWVDFVLGQIFYIYKKKLMKKKFLFTGKVLPKQGGEKSNAWISSKRLLCCLLGTS